MLPEGDRIKAMRSEDLDLVHRLEYACQQHPWRPQHFLDELVNPVAAVDLYWRKEVLAGFLCSWLIAGELQIQNIATALQQRRQGIAARLLEHVIERARTGPLDTILLEVRAGNRAAIALYQRFGFIVTDCRRGYYADGEDALLMKSHLK